MRENRKGRFAEVLLKSHLFLQKGIAQLLHLKLADPGKKEFIMFRSRRKRITIALMTIMTLMSSCVFSYAASGGVSIRKYNFPTTIKAGKDYSLKGTLKAKSRIRRVEIGIATSSGKWKYKYDNRKVNKKTFSIKKANKKLKFNKLKAGNYRYRIYVHTKGKTYTVLNQPFTVTGRSNSPGKITVSGTKYPASLKKGKPFTIKGKIKSSKKIKKVTIGVVDKSGKWTKLKYTKKKINSKTFNMKRADSSLKFGKLPAGIYTYKIMVQTTGGKATVASKKFSVTVGSEPNVSTSTNLASSGKNTEVNLPADYSFENATIDDGVVTLTGVTKPGTYKTGQKFSPAGVITSTETITRVEAGVIFTATNKWTENYVDKTGLNTTSFDLSSIASKLKFDQVPGGDYKYRIYVHTASGVHIALNHPFKVICSNKAQAALAWAIKIANDDSFTYGKRPATSRVGCYFCGTNKKNKPKGYEKTYVCMTFVHAAYAHGAGDPEMLKDCQGGKYTLSLNDSTFSAYSCWKKVGLCKDLKVSDLQPGDVICWYAADDRSGHLSMYAGNGDIVDAGIEGWGANTIAVRKGAADSYLKTGAKKSKKSYVMRYCK